MDKMMKYVNKSCESLTESLESFKKLKIWAVSCENWLKVVLKFVKKFLTVVKMALE